MSSDLKTIVDHLKAIAFPVIAGIAIYFGVATLKKLDSVADAQQKILLDFAEHKGMINGELKALDTRVKSLEEKRHVEAK